MRKRRNVSTSAPAPTASQISRLTSNTPCSGSSRLFFSAGVQYSVSRSKAYCPNGSSRAASGRFSSLADSVPARR